MNLIARGLVNLIARGAARGAPGAGRRAVQVFKGAMRHSSGDWSWTRRAGLSYWYRV